MNHAGPASHSPVNPATSRRLWRFAGIGFAIAGLIWVFYDIQPGRLVSQFSNIRWQWVALGVTCDILSYFCQGWRWSLLCVRHGKLSPLRATQAVYAGLFTNEILPLRPGEVVRAYLAARWMKADLASVLPTLVVERLFDGLWLALCVGLTAIWIPLPGEIVHAADILGIIAIAASVVVIIVMLSPARIAPVAIPGKPARLIMQFFARFTGGIKTIGLTRSFFLSLAVSSLIIVFQAAAFWFIMVACGLHVPLAAGAVVFLIVHLGTAIPNAPSNIGSFQFFCVVGLAIFGVDKTTAAAFSIAVFIILTLPLWIIGLGAIARSGMTLSQIRADTAHAIRG